MTNTITPPPSYIFFSVIGEVRNSNKGIKKKNYIKKIQQLIDKRKKAICILFTLPDEGSLIESLNGLSVLYPWPW